MARRREFTGGLAVLMAATLLLAACVPATQPFTVRTAEVLSECAGPSDEPPPTIVTANGRSSRLIAPPVEFRGEPAPLLISLHPFTMGPSEWEAYSGLAAAAAERGYWVLLPRGSDPGPRWSVPGGLAGGPDDIGWIDALVQQVATTACIDGGSVFAAGFSAGAAMAVALSCELPWRFTGIAASGGSNLTSTCPEADPVPALLLHGTADPIAPPTGSTVIFAPPLGLPVSEVVASYVARNGCEVPAAPFEISPSTVANRFSCTAAALEHWSMGGAGHTWAGTAGLIDAITGPTDQSFSATTAVLDFFDRLG